MKKTVTRLSLFSILSRDHVKFISESLVAITIETECKINHLLIDDPLNFPIQRDSHCFA